SSNCSFHTHPARPLGSALREHPDRSLARASSSRAACRLPRPCILRTVEADERLMTARFARLYLLRSHLSSGVRWQPTQPVMTISVLPLARVGYSRLDRQLSRRMVVVV